MTIKLKKGASIAELLAVIIIMGIIAAIAIPTVGVLLRKSREKAAVEDIRSIVSSMITYATSENFNGTIEFHGSDSIYSKETFADGSVTDNGFYGFVMESVPMATPGLKGIMSVTIENSAVISISFQPVENGIVYTKDDKSYSFSGSNMNDLKASEIK